MMYKSVSCVRGSDQIITYFFPPGVRVCQLKNILWWHWDRHAVMEVASAGHL